MATQKNIFSLLQVYLPSLLWVVAGIYCFLAFIPIPLGIITGLDPSWSYALSKAAAEKLIFGRDIIFTYGPFGYLIHGSVLEQNFWTIIIFRLIIHLSLFAVALAKILTLRNNLLRLSLGLSILLAYLTVLMTDYQILVAFLIIISSPSILSDPKSLRGWSLGLGALSGFFLLCKFTLGIYTLCSLVLLLSANIYDSLKSKSNVKISCLALLEALLVATSVAFIVLNPNYIYSLNKVFICIISSVILTLTIKFIQHLFILHYPESITLNKLPLGSISFYGSYFLGLIALIYYSFPSLTTYLKGSWEISSGYSSAMSIIGPAWQLGLGISQVVLILIILFFLAREGSSGFSISLAFVLAISFKHGFVRQDIHIMLFFSLTPIIVALCISQSKKTFSNSFSLFVHLYTLILLVFLPYSPPLLEKLAPNQVVNNTSLLLNLNQLRKQINASSIANMSEMKLPDNFIKIVKDKPIDIVPWEISLVAANNLNWKPRPIFQSYSAYTKFLDEANSQSLLNQPRDYIIYQFSSIDGRHPFFDEPKTFFNIFCNYKLSSEISNLVNTRKIFNLMLLEKRQSNICSPGLIDKKFSIPWKINHSIEASDRFFTRAVVKIEYSALGKIYKTLFRSPPVIINITYINEQKYSYRIIPENAENGVIISHLPNSDSDALFFFKGQLPMRVKSFSFSTINPILYKQSIEITLISHDLFDVDVKEYLLPNISQLNNIRFLDSQIDGIGTMDTQTKNQDKPFKRGDTISVYGWAIRKSSEVERTWVLLTYGSNNKPLVITGSGVSRPDVAEYFKNSKYTNSGWSIDFRSKDMPEGVHNIKAWIYEPTGNLAIPLNGSFRVEIQ